MSERMRSDDILHELKLAGYKFTGKRQAIVELFVRNQDKYLTAKDVFDEVKKTYPRISFDTVYRTISLLEKNHVIEHLEFSEDAAKYRLNCQRQHHHHLICITCGYTAVLDECPVQPLQDKITDFKIVNHQIAIYGYCKSCFGDSDVSEP